MKILITSPAFNNPNMEYLIRYAKARKRLNLFLAYLNDLDGKEEEEEL